MSKIKYTIDQLKIAVNESISMAAAAKKLNINYKTLATYAKANGFHKPNPGRKGLLGPRVSTKQVSLTDIINNKKQYRISKLRERLITELNWERKCNVCNLSKWQNKPLPLELHHKDGNRFNNSLENLQILCPNCHSQTHNWKGLNKKSHPKIRKDNYCIDCKIKIHPRSTRCYKCDYIARFSDGRYSNMSTDLSKLKNMKNILKKVNKTNLKTVAKELGISHTCLLRYIRKYKNTGTIYSQPQI